MSFNPYSMNAGTVVAIAGEDFALIASDTRLKEGYSIHTRDLPKSYSLTKSTILGCCGFHGDVLTLTKLLQMRLKMYKHEHHKDMAVSAVAAMLSTVLYYRRFFPYYTYNILAGLDSEGKGAVYSFDPVGSYEREPYRAGGNAGAMIQPLLDNQIGRKNMETVDHLPITREQAIILAKDVFTSATERDTDTGDGILIHVIDSNGVQSERVDLRRD